MSTEGREDDEGRVFRRYPSSVVLHARAGAKAVGLGAADLYALDILELSGARTPGEIGTRAGLTAGPATRLVERLEQAGHVRRATDPGDRRKVIVEPIAQLADLDTVLAPARRKIGEIIGGYSPEKREFLFDYFARAADAFQRAAGEISSAGTPHG